MSKTAFYAQIAHQERLHEKKALKFSKEAIEQYEVTYSLCDEILFDIEENVNIKDDIGRRAISMILFRIMGTVQSIKWLLIKGHYYDVSVLDRRFMESLGTCCYIFQNKGAGKNGLEKRSLCTSLDKFKAIAKTLQQPVAETDTANFYRQLCKFVHGNSVAIKTLVYEIEDEYDLEEELYTIRFSNPSTYDKGVVDSIANRPLLIH